MNENALLDVAISEEAAGVSVRLGLARSAMAIRDPCAGLLIGQVSSANWSYATSCEHNETAFTYVVTIV